MAFWKLWIATVSLAILCSCALLPSQFDNQEHAKLVTISQMTKSVEHCNDAASVTNLVLNLKYNLDWLKIYSQGLPNNGKMTRMILQLDVMVQGLSQRYENSDSTPSQYYCQQKVTLINESVNEIIAVSARRPR